MSLLRSTFAPVVFVDDEQDRNCVAYRVDPADPENTSLWRVLWDWKAYLAGQGIPDPPEPPEWDPPITIGIPTTPPITVPAAPFGQVIRITSDSDNARPVGMAYWPNINNHAGRPELRVLVSLDDRLTVFLVHKASGAVSRGETLPLPPSTGEGCYWSFVHPDSLYVPSAEGLMRYSVGTGETSMKVPVLGATHWHSSYDGQVHSFTMDGGAAVYRNGRVAQFPSPEAYDECQIDKSGEWLLIKEGARNVVADNRIIHLPSGRSWPITDKQGAVGHSDMGFGYMVGEDDQADPGGVFRRWRFTLNGPVDEGPVYNWGGWASMTRYVSHCNAKPGAPEGQRLLFSSTELGLVAVTMGARSRALSRDTYWEQLRANIDPTGEWACYSDKDMNVFVVKL